MVTEAERIAILETKLEAMAAEQTVMAAQVKEIRDLLIAAKGAKWAIIGMATLGGFVSAKLAAIAGFFGLFPSK